MSMKYPWKHGNWVQISHVMSKHMGSKLDNKYYMCGLDDLYMSAKFTKLALKCKVYIHGVTRKGG
eukprot:3162668-Ditylum_brightwellii.AAC.1